MDVVTLRAVLIYVAAKQQSFREFCRVLKPNGRLYVEEPIDRFGGPEPHHLLWGYDVTSTATIGIGLIKTSTRTVTPKPLSTNPGRPRKSGVTVI